MGMIMSAKPALRQLIANLYRDEGRREGLTNGDMPIRNFVHDYSIDGYGEPDGNGFGVGINSQMWDYENHDYGGEPTGAGLG